LGKPPEEGEIAKGEQDSEIVVKEDADGSAEPEIDNEHSYEPEEGEEIGGNRSQEEGFPFGCSGVLPMQANEGRSKEEEETLPAAAIPGEIDEFPFAQGLLPGKIGVARLEVKSQQGEDGTDNAEFIGNGGMLEEGIASQTHNEVGEEILDGKPEGEQEDARAARDEEP